MALGGFNELDFLTNIPILFNDDNRDSIFNWIRGGIDFDNQGNPDAINRDSTNTIVFKRKNVTDTATIKNYYKDTIYKNTLGDLDSRGKNISDMNPYLKLVKDFGESSFNAMRFEAADFAYLTDLGVYPINRLWVLRRFSDSTLIPNNLQDWTTANSTPPQPTYTMAGWIKPEDEKFFTMNFNEKWEVMTDRLDQVIFKILQEEFGLNAANVISLPGWSQGLLFGFLEAMGLTNFDAFNIPMGNPAVLQEAATRAKDANPGYGNISTMTLTLKTSYEQKYIGDIDPGNAMLDLIHNCVYMGTRNTEYVLKNTASGGVLDTLRNAINSGSDIEAWWIFIESVIKAFVNAINTLFDKAFKSENKVTTTNEGNEEPNTPTGDDKVNFLTSTATSVMNMVKNNSFLKSVLATVMKWRYALMGSIALMTGENSTPWHLTLGNPYSPFISLGNVVVDSVTMNFNNEFGYNDMPTRLDVEVSVRFGRNLGAQEIFQMFNNGYQRAYASTGESLGSGIANSGPAVEPLGIVDKNIGTAKNNTLAKRVEDSRKI